MFWLYDVICRPSRLHDDQTRSISKWTLSDILKQKPTDDNVKAYAVRLMTEAKSFEYTRTTLIRIEQEAREAILKLGGNSKLEKILDALTPP